MRRRRFLLQVGGALVAAPAAWVVAGCGGDDGDGVDAATSPDGAVGLDAAPAVDAVPPPDIDPAAPDSAPLPDAAATPDAEPSLCLSNGAADSAISANHGHSLSIPAADITAGSQKSYDIRGLGNHPHTLTVTAAHFTSLQAGDSVTITSSTDGHSHVVTVSCVS